MSKSIWHRYDEAPKHQDIIMTDTGCWAYRAELLALETELDRTRKALDVAVDALKEQQRWFGVIRVSLISHLNNEYGTLFKNYDADPTVVNIKRANDILNTALEQITALEQKD